MRHLRVLFALLIALSLVTGPVASAWVGAQMAAPMSDSGQEAGGMEDCDKGGNMQGQGDCPCCDTLSKCPNSAACMSKCGGHLVGDLTVPMSMLEPIGLPDRRADPPQPPSCAIKPPAPPPRA